MLRHLRKLIMGPAKDVIVIVGTTGVGKSQFSIEIAKKFGGEIINADSMQMYKGADIITNKHPIEEREGINHHVMNHVNWNEEYFIHRFDKEAKQAIDDIHNRGKIPIIIGGTHYYLNSLLFNNKTIKKDKSIDDKDASERLTKEQLDILNGPSEEVFEILKKEDPKVAEKFHPNDTRRIRRALEIYFLTNKKTSDIYSEQVESENEGSSLNYRTLAFWLFSEKSILDKRLDERVDKMFENGAMNEINELYDYYEKQEPKPDMDRGIWQVIGFKEFLPWLKGNKQDDKLLQQSMIDMKTRTRQYAKRQVKWIRDLLAVDLNKESKHGFINGGKLYILNATDLSKWESNVSKRGDEIVKNFIEYRSNDEISQAPEGLEKLLPSEEEEVGKEEDEESQWKHITCETCFNPDDSPLILVGSKQYEIHLKSKRHRSNLQRGKRKRDYEEWLAKKQQQEAEKKI